MEYNISCNNTCISTRHFSCLTTYFENKYTGNSQFLSYKSQVITAPLEGVGSMKCGW